MSWLRFLSLPVLVAAACGGSDDGASTTVTFDSLPQSDRDHFAAWNARVIKDCAWEQAFPALADEFPPPPGVTYAPRDLVDHAALLAANGDSPLIATPNAIVLLGTPAAELASEHDERSAQRTTNGITRRFEATANRDDGTCVITIGGEEVFRAPLVSAVPVVAFSDAASLAEPASTDLTPLATAGDVGALRSDPLLRHALAALVPGPRAHDALAAHLHIEPAVARALFPLGEARRPEVIRLPGLAGTTPFAPGAAIYGPTAVLTPVTTTASQVEAELLYTGSPTTADLVGLRATIAIAGDGTAVHAVSITPGPRVERSDAATVACFAARAVAAEFERAQLRSPAFLEQFDGCRALAADGLAALAADPTSRQHIAAVAMAAVTPGEYRGWDQALLGLVDRFDALGLSLTELDPDARIPALATVLDRRGDLRRAIDEPAAAAALGPAIDRVAFRWFFGGVEPGPALLADLRGALENVASPLAASTERMLQDLGSSIGAQSPGATAARCGAAMSGERRTRVLDTLAAVERVPFARRYAADRRAAMLQSCPADAALAALAVSAGDLTDFITGDRVAAASIELYGLAAEPLVEHALDERWTDDTLAALAALLDFARVSRFTFCDREPTRAEQAACVDASFGILSTSVALTPRHGALAADLAARWPGLGADVFLASRIRLEQAFFDGMWLTCDDAGFAAAKTRLLALLERLRSATRFETQFEIEQEIAELVDSTTCR